MTSLFSYPVAIYPCARSASSHLGNAAKIGHASFFLFNIWPRIRKEWINRSTLSEQLSILGCLALFFSIKIRKFGVSFELRLSLGWIFHVLNDVQLFQFLNVLNESNWGIRTWLYLGRTSRMFVTLDDHILIPNLTRSTSDKLIQQANSSNPKIDRNLGNPKI